MMADSLDELFAEADEFDRQVVAKPKKKSKIVEILTWIGLIILSIAVGTGIVFVGALVVDAVTTQGNFVVAGSSTPTETEQGSIVEVTVVGTVTEQPTFAPPTSTQTSAVLPNATPVPPTPTATQVSTPVVVVDFSDADHVFHWDGSVPMDESDYPPVSNPGEEYITYVLVDSPVTNAYMSRIVADDELVQLLFFDATTGQTYDLTADPEYLKMDLVPEGGTADPGFNQTLIDRGLETKADGTLKGEVLLQNTFQVHIGNISPGSWFKIVTKDNPSLGVNVGVFIAFGDTSDDFTKELP
jgi:hypothetical protein